MAKEKPKTGRPLADIDPDQVRKLAIMQCPTVEIAAFFDVDEKTIRNRFSDIVQKGREAGKISLRRKQFEVAQSGNVTMLIWLGKQYLGQSEKQESVVAIQPLPLMDYRDATDTKADSCSAK